MVKFVALASGGKDSYFNILNAQTEGHELVALANLHPKPTSPEEIDSFMFQTVGSKAVIAMAECLEVPLYRKELSEDEDKVIDEIVEILQDVLKDHPTVQGVSVGAIASTYQQVRVDKAVQRLGLTTLSYLWQRDQREIIDEIIASGIDARIIKVAGAGLTKDYLGKSLAEVRDQLFEVSDKYGTHPAGEGGEFETMVLDGPINSKKMVFVNPKVVQPTSDDVYYLSFDVATEPKASKGEYNPITPSLLSPNFETYAQELQAFSNTTATQRTSADLPQYAEQGPTIVETPEHRFYFTVRGKIDDVFNQLEDVFKQTGHELKEALHVLVVVQDLNNFERINAHYGRLFDFEGPPSRAAFQSKIGDEAYVTVFGAPRDLSGRGLHVQGRSYWAPAIIGPYSQARVAWGQDLVSGQIGLIPSTLQLHQDEIIQAVLSLQNTTRILDAVHGPDNWEVSVATVFISSTRVLAAVEKLWALWSRGKRVPLVVVEVERLPRDAAVEWLFQAYDRKYFQNFIPEDEDEDDYIWPPKLVSSKDYGYEYNYGFQRVRVAGHPNTSVEPSTAVVYSSKAVASPCVLHIPVSLIHVGGQELSDGHEVWVTNDYVGPKRLGY